MREYTKDSTLRPHSKLDFSYLVSVTYTGVGRLSTIVPVVVK